MNKELNIDINFFISSSTTGNLPMRVVDRFMIPINLPGEKKPKITSVISLAGKKEDSYRIYIGTNDGQIFSYDVLKGKKIIDNKVN